MATPVIMPRQGQSVESCLITAWHKKRGDRVTAGELLFSYETDKASFDEEAKAGGTLLEIFFKAGDDVPVLANVGVIGKLGESTAEFRPKGNEAETETGTAQGIKDSAAQETLNDNAGALATTDQDGRKKASPRAKRLARQSNIDYRRASPTGPAGRIIERDIAALQNRHPLATSAGLDECEKLDADVAVEGSGLGGRITVEDVEKARALPGTKRVSPDGGFEDTAISNIRKLTARVMHQSISTTAQLTLHSSFDASDILALRKKNKEEREKSKDEHITLTDMIIFAVSRTLLRHKALNAHFLGDTLRCFTNAHIGVAVDTERGLLVPTIVNADRKTLSEISAEMKRLAAECQAGTINPDRLRGASFTITNLGVLDIESFTPILNPPQTGILGVNNIIQRMKDVHGDFISYPAMGLSLTFDHRALDGAPAARFLKDVRDTLENFADVIAK